MYLDSNHFLVRKNWTHIPSPNGSYGVAKLIKLIINYPVAYDRCTKLDRQLSSGSRNLQLLSSFLSTWHTLWILGSHDSMTVLTNDPISLQICNCIALLIIVLTTACVKWITIVCEYISPGNHHVWYLAYLELATC